MSEEKNNIIENFFSSFSGATLLKIGGIVIFLLFTTSMFSSATSWLNPFSWFQSTREELIEENKVLQARIYELEQQNEALHEGEELGWIEWIKGDSTRVKRIDSLKKGL